MYLWGRGVPKDLIYAYMWADIVASAGEEYSDMLNVVKEEMTPSQITEAKKRIQECVRKQYKDC